MKHLFTHLLVVACGLAACICSVYSQQIPVFQQFLQQPALFNPARTGEGHGSGITAAYRKQWLVVEQAPASALLHGHFAILPNNDVLGLGFRFVNQRAFVLSRNDISLLGGIHLVNSAQNRLSLGLSFGMSTYGISYNELANIDTGDPLIQQADNKPELDAGLGLSYTYTQGLTRLHLDLTFGQLPASFVQTNDNNLYNFRSFTHLVVAGRLAFGLGSQLQLEPGLMYKSLLGADGFNNEPLGLQGGELDAQLRLLVTPYHFWVAAGMRSSLQKAENLQATGLAGLTAGVGVELNDQFRLSGFFEHHAGLGSSFELGVGYVLKPMSQERVRPARTPAVKDPLNKVVRNLGRMAQKRGLLPDIQPVVRNEAGGLVVSYRYRDTGTGYHFNAVPKLPTALGHLNEVVRELRAAGAVIDSIHLVSELLGQQAGLDQGAGLQYDAEELELSYRLDGQPRQTRISAGSLNMQQLILLKLALIRDHLQNQPELQALQLPANRWQLVIQTGRPLDVARQHSVVIYLHK